MPRPESFPIAFELIKCLIIEMSNYPKLSDKATREWLAANKSEVFEYEYWVGVEGDVTSRIRFNGVKIGFQILMDLKYDLKRSRKPVVEWLKCIKVEEKNK